MLKVPYDIWSHYEAVLKAKVKDSSRHDDFRKWLRYFWDFRNKYPLPESHSEQVRLFIEKLRQKNQQPDQLRQATYAVSLFFESQLKNKQVSPSHSQTHHVPVTATAAPHHASNVSQSGPANLKASVPPSSSRSFVPSLSNGSRYNEWRCLKKSDSPAWDRIIENLALEIKTRHYSRKTLKAYADWSRKFQGFLHNKPPEELSAADVKAYLTHLAVQCRVSASTQNQAFNSLLFLYRHIIKKDFGDHKYIPRAKKSRYIPVVLSRREIDSVLKHLEYPCNLVVKLLYGCGLRLFECVNLRVKNFNFDDGILTVHGKGSKDRTVPIPQTIMPELMGQLEAIKKLHDEDLSVGFAGVFLDDRLEKKYPAATKDFIWQWFFPQKTLTQIQGKKEIRRYHLHESHVQEALYKAVRRAKLTKRVTSHTFRHSFATHLLQANYDIRTIQELLGHSDVRTTMIYTHTIKSRTIKEARSPFDF